MLPPKKRLLTTEPHSFTDISQSQLRFHFQKPVRAAFALWNLSGPIRECFLSLYPVIGDVTKIPKTLEWALFVAEDSSKFTLIARGFQLEKSLWRRKIPTLICLIKGLRNQVASPDLLTASSVCRSCFRSVGRFQIDAYNYTFLENHIYSLMSRTYSNEHMTSLYLGLSFTFFSSVMIVAREHSPVLGVSWKQRPLTG